MPFLSSDDELAIVQAIQEAEKKTSGEVRVHIEKMPKERPHKKGYQLISKITYAQNRSAKWRHCLRGYGGSFAGYLGR